jgi:hypothetical protein
MFENDEDDDLSQEHGAPVDFGGPVFRSHRPVVISDDTDSGIPETTMPKGVRLSRENSTGGMPTDISNPPEAELAESGLREASTAPIAKAAPRRSTVSLRGLNPASDEEPAAPALPAGSGAGEPDLSQAQPGLPAKAAPTALEKQTTADRAQQAELRKGSGISQIGNPFARGALRGLNLVGSAASALVDPTIGAALSTIPGTEEHHEQLLGRNTKALNTDEAQGQKEAQTSLEEGQASEIPSTINKNLADTEEARARAESLRNPHKEEKWSTVLGILGPNGEPVQQEETSGQMRYGPITGAKAVKTPGETQEQNKLAYQALISKLDRAGLPTDPKSIAKSADRALKNGVITPADHAALRSYEAANQTPGTNLTVHVAGQEEGSRLAINKLFEGKEVLAHLPDGRRVQMSYADAQAQGIPPERLVALNANEAQQNRDKIASTGATFNALDKYRKDLKTTGGQLTENDRKAMEVLTSHVKTDPGFLGKAAGGILDSVFGEPLTGYSEKYLGGLMTKEQYNALSPAGRQLVADYYTTVIANFANMKNIMGSVGRNEMQLAAEVATVPLPYLDWNSASDAFDNKRNDIQQRAGSMPELYEPPKK